MNEVPVASHVDGSSERGRDSQGNRLLWYHACRHCTKGHYQGEKHTCSQEDIMAKALKAEKLVEEVNDKYGLELELTYEPRGASFSHPLDREANGTWRGRWEMKSEGYVFNGMIARFCPACQTTHYEQYDFYRSPHGKTLHICLVCDKGFCCLEKLKEHGRNKHHTDDVEEI